jgi:GTP-sensing pleiotropic transcriptional regulator CodY
MEDASNYKILQRSKTGWEWVAEKSRNRLSAARITKARQNRAFSQLYRTSRLNYSDTRSNVDVVTFIDLPETELRRSSSF